MTYIPLEPVESSMIAEIGYDRKKQTLRVLFNNGAAYDYPTFTERDWAAFSEAESKGAHFHRAIKPMFGHGRVTEAQLQKPCCTHDSPDDMCDESCLPCDPGCCDALTEAQRRRGQAAMAEGLERGRQLLERAREEVATLAGLDTSPDAEPVLACAMCHAVHSPEHYAVGDDCALADCDDGVLTDGTGMEDDDGTED